MSKVLGEKEEQLLKSLEKLSSDGISQEKHRNALLSRIDVLTRNQEGLEFVYEHIEEILNAGVFNNTNWAYPRKLVPALVKGTLCAGFPMVVYETLSELRMLRVAQSQWKLADFSAQQAEHFLHEAIVASFSLVFDDGSEETRINLSKSERKRLNLLFNFILSKMSLDSLKGKLAKEVSVTAAQRPIQTETLERMLTLVKDNIDLTGVDESELTLMFHTDALFHPTVQAKRAKTLEVYQQFIDKASKHELKEEAVNMGKSMNRTGLVSSYHVLLVKTLSKSHPDLLAQALTLSPHGKADLERHSAFICEIIDRFVFVENKQTVYGLSKMLNRNLLSRKAVWNALNKLFRIELHESVKTTLDSSSTNRPFSQEQWLCSGMINLLGQPLGVGQGLNPTCQSARGLSMWSQHSPEKLINKTINAATQNQLKFRYEGELITSKISEDTSGFDFNLDPVSLVLVPHLDSVYQQMMQKAMVKHPGEDPHISVNPAFYGHWIQTGFVSCYKPLLNAIQDYDSFVKIFYAAFHPEFNGGYNLVYPIPLGIFITSSDAQFLGYHAVSLLRVKQDEKGVWRAYFFNPNNEGRQNWGQGIIPSVAEHGENHGESSLPFYQFVSRVYAFNYNSLEAEGHLDSVNENDVQKVTRLARQSWGEKYVWL